MKIQLEPQHHDTLVRILGAAHLPKNTKVYVFGSRAKGTAKKFSDIDLALQSPDGKLLAQILTRLAQDFEESGLPYKVDLVDMRDIDQNFLKVIEADKVWLWSVG